MLPLPALDAAELDRYRVASITKKYLALEDFYPAFVYVIQAGDDGPVKIGSAAKPSSRLSELQCGSWMELNLRAVVPVLACIQVEQVSHVLAASRRIRREWFDLEPLEAVAIVAVAADLCGQDMEPLHDAVARIKEGNRKPKPFPRRDREYIQSRQALLRAKLGIEAVD